MYRKILLFLIILSSAFFAQAAPTEVCNSATTCPTNTIESIAILAILAFLIFLATTFSQIKIFGVVGACIILLISLQILFGGIYVKAGEITTGTDNYLTINTTNSTLMTVQHNTTVSNVYEKLNISNTVILGNMNIDFSGLVGILLLCISLYAFFYYARVFKGTSGKGDY